MHMKADQDRSSPWKSLNKPQDAMVPALRNGALGNDKQSFRGTTISPDTYAMLAAKGSVSPNVIHRAFRKGILVPQDFRKAFWDEIDYSSINIKTAKLINEFRHILF